MADVYSYFITSHSGHQQPNSSSVVIGLLALTIVIITQCLLMVRKSKDAVVQRNETLSELSCK